MRKEITYRDVKNIALAIIKAWPYNACGMPKSFAQVDSKTEANHPTFGRVYLDYKEGDFWAKDWVAGGALKSEMKKEYGALLVERQKAVANTVMSSTECTPYWFCFMDTPDCVNCPDGCKRNVSGIDDMLLVWARTFIREFMRFGLYEHDGDYYWLNPEMAAALGTNKLLIDIESFTTDAKLTFSNIRAGLKDDARACGFFITLCSCGEYIDDTFTYNSTDPAAQAQAGCATC
jgi:hypothetical protein